MEKICRLKQTDAHTCGENEQVRFRAKETADGSCNGGHEVFLSSVLPSRNDRTSD